MSEPVKDIDGSVLEGVSIDGGALAWTQLAKINFLH